MRRFPGHGIEGWYIAVNRYGITGGQFWKCICGYEEPTWEARTSMTAEALVTRHVESLDLSGLPSMEELLARVHV